MVYWQGLGICHFRKTLSCELLSLAEVGYHFLFLQSCWVLIYLLSHLVVVFIFWQCLIRIKARSDIGGRRQHTGALFWLVTWNGFVARQNSCPTSDFVLACSTALAVCLLDWVVVHIFTGRPSHFLWFGRRLLAIRTIALDWWGASRPCVTWIQVNHLNLLDPWFLRKVWSSISLCNLNLLHLY